MRYDLFKVIKESGCVNLAYGLETSSKAHLAKVGKRMAKDTDIDALISDAKRAGVFCSFNFMFGLPGETEDDAKENIKFLRRNAKNFSSVNPSAAFCAICPGALAYDEPEKYGIDIDKGAVYWESFDGKNNYLKRIEWFEEFISVVHELKIPSIYSAPKLINKNELIATYYFSMKEYEKAIPYFEESIEKESSNQTIIEKLGECKRLAQIEDSDGI